MMYMKHLLRPGLVLGHGCQGNEACCIQWDQEIWEKTCF